jgi:hypothetical protein
VAIAEIFHLCLSVARHGTVVLCISVCSASCIPVTDPHSIKVGSSERPGPPFTLTRRQGDRVPRGPLLLSRCRPPRRSDGSSGEILGRAHRDVTTISKENSKVYFHTPREASQQLVTGIDEFEHNSQIFLRTTHKFQIYKPNTCPTSYQM